MVSSKDEKVTVNADAIIEHIAYLPFGEVFVEERNNNWNTPYKFNAKELDEETGLYYYGSRYFDSRTSVWYGVDPLGEKLINSQMRDPEIRRLSAGGLQIPLNES